MDDEPGFWTKYRQSRRCISVVLFPFMLYGRYEFAEGRQFTLVLYYAELYLSNFEVESSCYISKIEIS